MNPNSRVKTKEQRAKTKVGSWEYLNKKQKESKNTNEERTARNTEHGTQNTEIYIEKIKDLQSDKNKY